MYADVPCSGLLLCQWCRRFIFCWPWCWHSDRAEWTIDFLKVACFNCSGCYTLSRRPERHRASWYFLCIAAVGWRLDITAVLCTVFQHASRGTVVRQEQRLSAVFEHQVAWRMCMLLRKCSASDFADFHVMTTT